MSNGEHDNRGGPVGGGLTDAGARELLAGLAPPRHAENAPPRAAMLAAAEAASPPGSRSLLSVRRPLGLRRSLAVFALAALALLAVGGLQVWYSCGDQPVPPDHPSQLLAPDAAWASVDGVVLEYEFVAKCAERLALTDGPWVSHAVKAIVEDTAEQYAHLNPPGYEFPLVHIASSTAFSRGPLGWTLQRIVVATGDEAVLSDLDSRMQQIPGVWGPRRYSETLYYNEKYPDLVYPGRVMIFDGLAKRIPQDMTSSEMFHLSNFQKEILEQEPGIIAYYAHLRLGAGDYPGKGSDVAEPHLGDVVRISVNSDRSIVLDTVAENASFRLDEKYMSSGTSIDPENPENELVTKYLPTVSVTFDEDALPQGFDPIAELQAEYDRIEQRDQERQDPAMQSYTYYYLLFSEERLWQNLNKELSPAEREWSLAVAESGDQAASSFADEHDDIFVSDRGYKRCFSLPLTVGDELAVLLQAGIRTTSPRTAAEFKETFEKATGLIETPYEPPKWLTAQ